MPAAHDGTVMDERMFYHALAVTTASNYRTLRLLRARYGSWEQSWNAYRPRSDDPQRLWSGLEKHGIELVLADEAGYPSFLREIPNPPFGLYVKGDLSALRGRPAIAIVGTRRATSPGKALAREFASVLSRAGCVIVSGLAFGIDAAAHGGAIEARRPTIAVLANGLDEVYPASHRRLADHIIEGGGALVSEYPPSSPPLAYRFLERNRLVSGVARATVIIEAPERSGVIATARFVNEQNRDLYVVPGPATHPNYRGSHRLIRSGAILAASPADVLEDLGFDHAPAPETAAATPAERSVIGALRAAGRALAIDEIIAAATLTSSIVNHALTVLILKGAVREEDGRYALCN